MTSYKVVAHNPLVIESLTPGVAQWQTGRAYTFPAGRRLNVLELRGDRWLVYKKLGYELTIAAPLLVTEATNQALPGRCLRGLHGRADGRMQAVDFDVVARTRMEAVKLMSTAAPEDVDALRAINPQMFILVRLFADFRGRVVNPYHFAGWLRDDMARFYARGVRHYEIHNEPNLRSEGWGLSWNDGRDFAQWWLAVRNALKAVFPDALFGFPGLSPDGFAMPERANDIRFFTEAAPAVLAADFVCAHAYWVNESSMRQPNGGMSWAWVRARVNGKPLYITEFSNPNAAEPMAAKGAQYRRYYELLAAEPGVAGAFAFVCSSSGGFEHEAWRREDGSLTDITHEFCK